MARHNGAADHHDHQAGHGYGASFAGFAGGVLVGMLASRLIPPVVAQARGMAQGGDAIDGLIEDHRHFTRLLTRMQSAEGALQRSQLLLRLKRGLARHAMAEEDAVYPALWDEDGHDSTVRELYQDHADIKHHLYRLEASVRDDAHWRTHCRELHELLERHAKQEEEEEFPRLRAHLDDRAQRLLGGAVQREKALIL